MNKQYKNTKEHIKTIPIKIQKIQNDTKKYKQARQ